MTGRGWPRLAALALVAAAAMLARAAAQQEATPSPAPSTATPEPATLPLTTSIPGAASPGVSEPPLPPPAAAATQPPIIVEPPAARIAYGRAQVLRVSNILGQITAVLANPAIADLAIDQVARTVTLTGKSLGATKLTVTDARGVTRDVPILVAELAGEVPAFANTRITGNPASAPFVAEAALDAARRAVKLRPGSRVVASSELFNTGGPLQMGDLREITVPVIVQGEGYIDAAGATRVMVENFAQPRLPPSYLMVSDYPERLTANGLLFHADVDPYSSARFLYYHYNPKTEPDRLIVLWVRNNSDIASAVAVISGEAGPGPNEMDVGHKSTERFLDRLAQAEGTVYSIPPHAIVPIISQPLPAGNVVSHLMEIRELQGASLHIDLIAQDANAPMLQPQDETLLKGDVLHARGVYKVPEFFYDPQWDTSAPPLEIPIGQIPVPNLREGQALAGDYGVLQQITVRIVNSNPRNPSTIALYANPRGGRATGTFIIDGVLVRAHAMAPFGHYKLREYTVPPGGFIRTTIVTMPEGGSSYPVRLIVGPDDGSSSPGSSTSLVY
jgi:hypothetical protein